MQTVPRSSEGQNQTGQDTATPTRRSWWQVGLAVLVALAVGAVGGALLTRGGEDSPYVIRAAGGDLTARQEEMVAMVGDYVAGWQATDGDQVASFMAADGYVEYVREAWVFHVADGSLQDRITNGPYDSLRRTGPMVVYDDRVVIFGTVNTGMLVNWLSVIQFTDTGDVQILSETIDHWL